MKRNHFAIRRGILIFLVCFMSCTVIAQKVNLDTLTIDELNLYKDKAVKMRNAGMIVTLGGIGLSVVGMIIGETTGVTVGEYGVPIITISSFILGLTAPAVGIPLWAVGGSRKTKAEFYSDLNLYKSMKMRNTGMVVALVGLGATVTGAAFGIYALSSGDIYAAPIVVICGVVGVPCLAVGIPLWAMGAKRKSQAELALHTLNIPPEGSMALGLGITIRF